MDMCFLFLLDMHSGGALLGHVVTLWLIISGPARLFSIAATPYAFPPPLYSVLVSPYPHKRLLLSAFFM